MTQDYTTIRITHAARDAAEELKHDDETWSDYVQRCGDHPRPVQELIDAGDLGDTLMSKEDVEEACRAAIREELEGVR